MSMSLFEKVKDFIIGYDEDDEGEDLEEAHPEPDGTTAAAAKAPADTGQNRQRTNQQNATSARTADNVVKFGAGTQNTSEMVLIEPRAFDEMPQVIDALKQRKSVILNMTLIRQEEAQRAVDFVAGGTYAIDGHYERIGDNIFLFTPSCVQVSTPTNIIHEVTRPIAGRPANRGTGVWTSDPIAAAQ
jgi:cell division inhibitor SepF